MSSDESNKVIDLHAHIVFPETMNRAGSFGPELLTDADGIVSFRFGYEVRGDASTWHRLAASVA